MSLSEVKENREVLVRGIDGDARWIGHYLSPSTYAGIKKYIQSLQTKGVIGNELE